MWKVFMCAYFFFLYLNDEFQKIKPFGVNDGDVIGILSGNGPLQFSFDKRITLCSWNAVKAGYGGGTISCWAFQWLIYGWVFIEVDNVCARCGGKIYVGLGRLTPPISSIVLGSFDSSSISQIIRPLDGIATGWWIVLVIWNSRGSICFHHIQF